MEILLGLDTRSWIAFIAIVFVVTLFFIFLWKKRDELIKHKRVIDVFPTIISTLGVLGTFYGITKGLWYFDTAHLNDSIPIQYNSKQIICPQSLDLLHISASSIFGLYHYQS